MKNIKKGQYDCIRVSDKVAAALQMIETLNHQLHALKVYDFVEGSEYLTLARPRVLQNAFARALICNEHMFSIWSSTIKVHVQDLEQCTILIKACQEAYGLLEKLVNAERDERITLIASETITSVEDTLNAEMKSGPTASVLYLHKPSGAMKIQTAEDHTLLETRSLAETSDCRYLTIAKWLQSYLQLEEDDRIAYLIKQVKEKPAAFLGDSLEWTMCSKNNLIVAFGRSSANDIVLNAVLYATQLKYKELLPYPLLRLGSTAASSLIRY